MFYYFRFEQIFKNVSNFENFLKKINSNILSSKIYKNRQIIHSDKNMVMPEQRVEE